MDLKDQRFGIEIEMTGITRQRAAEIAAEYFGTSSRYVGSGYDIYAALDSQGRQWKFMSDSSITAQRKEGRQKVAASREYQTEMVSPICRYEDIIPVQEIIRKLKEAGAITNTSCGIHVHIDASPFDARTLRNITNIMASKEDLIYKALGVSVARQNRWCQPVEQRFLDQLNARRPRNMREVERIWYNGASRSHEHYDNSRYHCLNLHSVFQKGTVEFRLFNGTLHAGKIKAYIQFCLAIGAQALNQTCASRRKTQTTNEKYTFRTWLLRLGLNGDEFATARQHLLANLPGCIAWRDPAQAEAQKERLRQKREKEREQARLERAAVEAVPQDQATEQTEQAEVSDETPAFVIRM
ncbi:MAG: amidoligase family protein [Enterocloster asparagiformis]|nr:amidoligase family protein [Enterocloster asparagiformis]